MVVLSWLTMVGACCAQRILIREDIIRSPTFWVFKCITKGHPSSIWRKHSLTEFFLLHLLVMSQSSRRAKVLLLCHKQVQTNCQGLQDSDIAGVWPACSLGREREERPGQGAALCRQASGLNANKSSPEEERGLFPLGQSSGFTPFCFPFVGDPVALETQSGEKRSGLREKYR